LLYIVVVASIILVLALKHYIKPEKNKPIIAEEALVSYFEALD